MMGVYIHLFVFLVALAMAFPAQWALPPQRRTRIIFVTAAVPPALLIAALLAAYVIWDVPSTELSWFQLSVSVLFFFMTMIFVGLVGAILGTELASLAHWLLRRRG